MPQLSPLLWLNLLVLFLISLLLFFSLTYFIGLPTTLDLKTRTVFPPQKNWKW
uniref:ATP synthase complex subunit 8 n=1 Tax=Calocaris macandreae TaxID=1267412 RepID=L0E7E7_CALMF|nr:ATP synthase F0 subunit 8 [Calocaris macandreae]